MFKEYMADALLIVALIQFWFRRMFFLASKLYQKKQGGICWQPKLASTGLTKRSDRSGAVADPAGARPVWPVGPTGLTGLGGVQVQLEFLIDLDL